MKKIIYTFILFIGFQFVQGQEVIDIGSVAQGSLDGMNFPVPLPPPSVHIHDAYFKVVNTNSKDLLLNDTIFVSVLLNDSVFDARSFVLSSGLEKDSTTDLLWGKLDIITKFIKSGETNSLCVLVASATFNEVWEAVGKTYCASFTATVAGGGSNIVDIDNLANISIYPNPVGDNLKIDNLEENTTIDIYSITGQRVQSVSSAMGSIEIDMSNLSNGMYIVKLQNEKNTRTEKIQVLKFVL